MPDSFFQSFERPQFLWNLNLLKPVLWTSLSEGRHSRLPLFIINGDATLFPGSFGKLLSPLSGHSKSPNARKKVERLEKTWKDFPEEALRTHETQIPEMGKCRLCQRPTQEIKDLIRSDTSLRGRPWKGNILARPILPRFARLSFPFPSGPFGHLPRRLVWH